MSNYIIRQNLLKLLAKNHPDIRHELPVNGGLRKSFFKHESDLTATNIAGTTYTGPSAIFKHFSGRLIDRDGSLRVRNLNEWLFLDRIAIRNTSPSITETKEDVYDRMLQVTMDIVDMLIADWEENQGCGWFKDLDLSSFHWEEEGPIADNYYGWKLTFQDETKRQANIPEIPEVPDETNLKI